MLWQHEPMSGKGALIEGGRFNSKGTPALYTSVRFDIAYREADQGIGKAQPVTLVTYNADVEDIFDLTNAERVRAQGIPWQTMEAVDWRHQMDTRGKSEGQILADHLIAQGHAGIMVQSFADGARVGDFNVVLWKWGDDLPTKVRLIDDNDRIGTVARRTSAR